MFERQRTGRRRALLAAVAILLAACANRGGSTPSRQPQPAAGAQAPTTPAMSPAGSPASPAPAAAPAGGRSFAVAGSPPVAGTPWFLTIGDSITAGYTRDPTREGTNSAWPVQLEALLAGSGRPWQLFDVACSGETTITYRTLCPQRAAIPFLANASQHDVAVAAITAHLSDLRLIIIDLGSNDLIYSAVQGAPLSSVAPALQERMDAIIGELRRLAPQVPLVVANYYDPFQNSSPATVPQLMVVNATLGARARQSGELVADFFSAINISGDAHPDLCTHLDCAHLDPVHPTVAGHARLAAAAAAVVPPA